MLARNAVSASLRRLHVIGSTQGSSSRKYATNRHRKPQGRRLQGYGATCANADHFKWSMIRGFTRESMKRFGVDTGLEDAMLVLSVNGVSYRKLDAKKRSHFSELYSESLLSIIPEYGRLTELQFEVVKIDVPPILTEVVIRWRCHGDERDEEIQQVLTTEAESIRRKLSETLYNSNVPRLKFIGDRTHLTQEEMNRLFEMADYGMQYRAVSHTAAVLGPAAAGVKREEAKPEKVPRWLRSRIEMKEARRRAREAALSAEQEAGKDHPTNVSNVSSDPDCLASKSCN